MVRIPIKVTEHERIRHIDGFEPDLVHNRYVVGRQYFDRDKFNEIVFYEYNDYDYPEDGLDGNGTKVSFFVASYVIGAQWIKQIPRDDSDSTRNTALFPLIVTPKVDCQNIDFLRMFDVCFQSGLDSAGFSQIYGINFEEEPIETEAFSSILSPLVASHFIYVVKKLVAKGLKREYVAREENLHKVKGRIDVTRNDRRNVMPRRYDRVYCRYEEYTVDNKENRLIKKALGFCEKIFNNPAFSKSSSSIKVETRRIRAAFSEVGDEISLSEIRGIREHRLYREYGEAIRLARMILQRYDYSIHNVDSADSLHRVPPFWINMALLYEYYVYGLLVEAYGGDVDYQFRASLSQRTDFLLRGPQPFILDAKYKPQITDFHYLDLDTVRQLSAYARDQKILKRLGYEAYKHNAEIPRIPCAVIYPYKVSRTGTAQNPFLTKPINKLCYRMDKFIDIYKIGIPLPQLPGK